MKKLILLLSLVSAFATQAAEVRSARYIAAEDAVELEVSHGGGCGEHSYELVMSDYCAESYPVQCAMTLVHHNHGDYCEAYLHRTVKVSVEHLNLKDGYFNGAGITVFGDNGTKAHFSLPFIR